jgi:hypothetical protein
LAACSASAARVAARPRPAAGFTRRMVVTVAGNLAESVAGRHMGGARGCSAIRQQGRPAGRRYWRERVGIEPTGATEGASIAVLKTGRTTRPDPLPLPSILGRSTGSGLSQERNAQRAAGRLIPGSRRYRVCRKCPPYTARARLVAGLWLAASSSRIISRNSWKIRASRQPRWTSSCMISSARELDMAGL